VETTAGRNLEIRLGLKTKAVFSDRAFMGLVLLALLLFKIPQLALPCFWDEGWSYMPAILKMAETGPMLFSDPRYTELFRGHPLLFYDTAALWIMLFGRSFVAMRILPMVISMLLLIVMFRFARKNFGRKTAMIAVGFMLIQSVFLAQSSMMLPEMLLALLSLLTLDAFLSGKKSLYILWATLLLFTKETGIVLTLLCLVITICKFRWRKEPDPFMSFIRSGWHLFLPLGLIALFFIIQKVIMGWFFFPEHIEMIRFSVPVVFDRLKGYSSFLYIGFGRNLLTFGALAALIYAVVRKVRIDKKELEIVWILLSFMVIYILFLSINFYSPRYLLSVLPVFILLCVFIITRSAESKPLIGYCAFLVLFANNIWFTWNFRQDGDDNLGFADALEVHRQAVGFCDAQQWQQKNLATHFLLRFYLTHPEAGYVAPGREFTHVSAALSDSTAIAVITSTEYSKEFMESIRHHNPVLVKRFEKRGSWAEVYLIK
jgi:4-amino-4-deoxy-L-arabinose transferase-like glycosyltransferase